MRDDQIAALVKREMAYIDNLSVLRSQQAKIRMDSMMSAICEKRCLLKTIFRPEYFYKRVEEIYKIKAQSFNEEMAAMLAREKLKI
mgnify:FL=1